MIRQFGSRVEAPVGAAYMPKQNAVDVQGMRQGAGGRVASVSNFRSELLRGNA